MLALSSTATRDSLGSTESSKSTSLAPVSPPILESPVILPPGRARLFTNPPRTGSAAVAMTIGIVVVAFCAAAIADDGTATMTSTFNCTSSAARPGKRSNFPSAERHSITRFLPST